MISGALSITRARCLSAVTKCRDRTLALKFLKESIKRHGRHETIVTDRSRSFGALLKDMGRGDDREIGRWLNNWAQDWHLHFDDESDVAVPHPNVTEPLPPFHASVHNHFATERHVQDRITYKETRASTLADWRGLLAA